MEFVNSIAKIVHMEVSLHGGAPNKNIGDAFLLVWKLPKGFTSRDIPRLKDLPQLPNESSMLSEIPQLGRMGKDIREMEGRDPAGSLKEEGSSVVKIHAFGGANPVAHEGSASKMPSGEGFQLAPETAFWQYDSANFCTTDNIDEPTYHEYF